LETELTISEEVEKPEGEVQAPEKPKRMYHETEFKQVIAQRDSVKQKARELEVKLQEIEKQQLEKNAEYQKLYESEKERAARLESEKQELHNTAIKAQKLSALKLQAKESGMIDVSDAGLFVNLDDISLTDDGNIEGVNEAIEKLKTAKPHLFAQQTPPGIHKGTPGTNGGVMTREELLKNPLKMQELFINNPTKYREIMG
jgi:predicted phage tail protein